MLKEVKRNICENFYDAVGFIQFIGRYILFGAVIYALWYIGGIILVILGLILWRAYKRSKKKDD